VLGCRLLTAAQQNTGNPETQREGCVTGVRRLEALRIADTNTSPRDVEVVIYNTKDVTSPLAGVDLNYTVRVYQWVPERK